MLDHYMPEWEHYEPSPKPRHVSEYLYHCDVCGCYLPLGDSDCTHCGYEHPVEEPEEVKEVEFA